MANNIILTRLYMHPMIKHGPTLMAFIKRKQNRLVKYVLRWPQMGSILMDDETYDPANLDHEDYF
jgi:hypothetical protein